MKNNEKKIVVIMVAVVIFAGIGVLWMRWRLTSSKGFIEALREDSLVSTLSEQQPELSSTFDQMKDNISKFIDKEQFESIIKSQLATTTATTTRTPSSTIEHRETSTAERIQ